MIRTISAPSLRVTKIISKYNSYCLSPQYSSKKSTLFRGEGAYEIQGVYPSFSVEDERYFVTVFDNMRLMDVCFL